MHSESSWTMGHGHHTTTFWPPHSELNLALAYASIQHPISVIKKKQPISRILPWKTHPIIWKYCACSCIYTYDTSVPNLNREADCKLTADFDIKIKKLCERDMWTMYSQRRADYYTCGLRDSRLQKSLQADANYIINLAVTCNHGSYCSFVKDPII